MGKKAFSPSALLTYGLALVMCIVAGCGVLGVFLPATGYHPGLSMQLPSVYTAAGHLLPSFLTPVHAVMVSPALATSVGKAVLIGTMATAFSLLLTFMMLAYLHRQMYAVQVILSPVLAMPHVAIAAGLVFLFSPSGWAARVTEALLGTATVSPLREMIQALWVSPDPWGITAILVLIIKETAFLLFVALAAVNRPQMKRQEQIALTLGYPASSVFWRVLAPELYAKLRLGVIAVLCYGVSQVEVNAVASTSLPPTLGVRVLQWYDDPDLLNQYVAAAAAALQVFVVACVVSAWIVAGKIVRIGHRFWSVSVPQLGRESHHVRHVPALMHLRPFRRVPHIRRHYRNLISRALRFVTETIPIWGSRVTFGVLVTLAVMSSVGMAIWSISGRWSYPSVAPTLYSAKYWQKAEIWLVAFNT
ncbi:MAG: hypothetical protein K0U36_03825, partial [Alphaproteobacteria bacterium]|nr:hypothetical protein [Alphaproteobacteria bacterium]